MSHKEETAAAIEYLRDRRHDIGQVFMPPDGNGLRRWVDGKACTSKDILALAEQERRKSESTTIDEKPLGDSTDL